MPVEAIAIDLLGLWIEEEEDLDCSGVLLPSERRIMVNASEPPQRRRSPARSTGKNVLREQQSPLPQARVEHRGRLCARTLEVRPD